jgi:ankyrin repeat protein
MKTRLVSVHISAAWLAIVTSFTFVACKQELPLNQESARRELKRTGVDFNKESFIESARNGQVERVRLFLRAGINPDATDEQGRTALMEAASSNAVPTIQTLITLGATLDLKDRDGDTALIHAAITGSVEALKVLANGGAFVNAADNRGSTALIYCVLDGSYECADALLERGADIEATTSDGYTALLLLVKNTKQEERKSQSWRNAFVKEKMDPIKTLRTLIEHGADVNATNKKGETALRLAEVSGVTEVIRLLKEAGANS